MSATVLLAEDDAPSRQIYSTVLEGEGYHVIEVPDGQSALDVLNRQPVDLLRSRAETVVPCRKAARVVRGLGLDVARHEL